MKSGPRSGPAVRGPARFSRASNPRTLGKDPGHAASCPHHGSRRARLPQLQRRLPQRPPLRGRRLHRDADPVHRRSEVSAQPRRRALPERDRDPRRERAHAADQGRAHRRRRLQLLGREPRVRDAQGQRGACRGRELPAARPARDDADGHRSRRRRLRRADGFGQEPDDPRDRRDAQGRREARRGGSASDAVREPRGAAGAAIRDARGPRPLRHHDRGARGVRAPHHLGHDHLRRRRLRRHPQAGAGRVRRAAVGRGEQRSALLRAGRPRGGRRSAPRGSRDPLPPRRGQPAHGQRDRDQQDGLGVDRTGERADGHDPPREPVRDGRQGQQPRDGGRPPRDRGQARAGGRGRSRP